MIRMKRVIPLLIALAFGATVVFSGCAGPSQQKKEPRVVPVKEYKPKRMVKRADKSTVRPEQVNLYDQAGDDWTATWEPVLEKPASFIEVERANGEKQQAREQAEKARIRQVRGYRVQLANVLSEDQAKAIKQRAEALFDSVYIFFRSPNFRVRGGDFTRRSEADAAAGEAKQMGFRGAWVVPDKVNVRE